MSTATLFSRAHSMTKTKFHQLSIFSDRVYDLPTAVTGVLTALMLGLWLAACQTDAATTPKVERPVQVQRVAFASETPARDFVGVVRARHETDLGFRVGGKIVARPVNVGDRVRAGDLVASLEAQDLKLQVELAAAELASATSSLAQAATDFARYTSLKSSGFASNADFDRKKAAKDEAQGRLDRARRSLELARNQLGYAELKASADGVITASLAEPGQVVALGQPVVRLAHNGEKEAVIALPETWLEAARQATATVRLWSDPDRIFIGQLRELSPQADPATRTYAARFTILDPDDRVAFGMTAAVTLSRSADQPIARLPLSAVLNRGTGSAVYVVGPAGQLELRPVNIASFNEAAAFVTSGLAAGEEVVTLGVQKLEAGLKVRTIEVH